MSEAAAPSAPTTAPTTAAAPEAGATPQTGQETPAETRARQRIELSKLADDDEIVMVVDGQEVAMPAAKARQRWQQGESATKRYQEAARKTRDAEELLHAVATTIRDPKALHRELAGLGLSPRQMAEEFLRIEAEEAALTPEQRRLRELESEQERLLAEREAEAERRQVERVQYREQTFTRVFVAGLEAAGLAGAPQAVQDDCAWAFKELVEAAESEGRKLSKADIANAMKSAARARASHYAAHLDEDAILARLTPELLAKYQAKATGAVPTLTPQAPHQPRDDRGRFQPPGNQGTDVNGRRIIRSTSNLFGR